jgi:hypothetical protein
LNSNPFQKAASAAWVELSNPNARQWYADSIISTVMMLLKFTPCNPLAVKVSACRLALVGKLRTHLLHVPVLSIRTRFSPNWQT